MKINKISSALITALLALSLSACGGGGGGGGGSPAPGIKFSKTTLTTSEDGTIDTFAVTLKTKPASDVEITVKSLDITEGLIRSDHDTSCFSCSDFSNWIDLTFTPANWNIPQIIEVKGQPDPTPVLDGNQTYKVAVTWVWSMDLNYIKVAKPSIDVTNIDTDGPGITVSPTSLSTVEGGRSDSFSVRLNLKPTGTVTVPLTISDASEGTFDYSRNVVTKKTLTFDQSNWLYPQWVYVYPVDDVIADGSRTYEITVGPATSTDADYNGLIADTVSVTNDDNDIAGFTLSANTLTTAEWGQTATFTVKLNTEPTEDVVIPVTSTDLTEGQVSSNEMSPSASLDLTFTPANWRTPQTVTVNPVDDTAQDGDITYNITVGPPTGATEYAALSAKAVAVTNIDDDSARVNIQGSNLQTNEGGKSDTFIVSLAKEPTDTVVIKVTSNDTTEGRVKGGSSPSTPVDSITLTFTTADWKTAQTVTVVGQDDNEIDGDQIYTIGVAVDTGLTLDDDYLTLPAQSVSATNADNDKAGLTVSNSYVYAYEGGSDGSFTVALKTKPVADVIVPLSVPDANELLISKDGGSTFHESLALTFTPANWSTNQTVTVQAVDDFVAGSWYQNYSITLGPATSADTNYEGLAAVTKQVTVYDNDTAGLVITPSTGLTTSEDGLSATFTVALSSEPVANVFVSVSSGNPAEGLLSGGDSPTMPVDTITLEFAPSEWRSAQTVTVHGQDDTVLDGPIAYQLTVATVPGTDSMYNAVYDQKVTVTNSDDEKGVSETKTLTLADLPYHGQVAPASTSTYTLFLSAGWKYTLTAANVTDDIKLEVRGGNNTILCTSNNIGAKKQESCAFTTPADGIVKAIINGAGTENGAAFKLSLSEPTFSVIFETYGFDDNSILLYDSRILSNPTAPSLRSHSGIRSSQIAYDLAPGATYYLKVMPSWPSWPTKNYMVQVTQGTASLSWAGMAAIAAGEPDDTPNSASVLTLKQPLERYLTEGDIDWFMFTAPMP